MFPLSFLALLALAREKKARNGAKSYILLLFIDVADLEPDVLFGQGSRRVMYDIFEALRTRKKGKLLVKRKSRRKLSIIG